MHSMACDEQQGKESTKNRKFDKFPLLTEWKLTQIHPEMFNRPSGLKHRFFGNASLITFSPTFEIVFWHPQWNFVGAISKFWNFEKK